MTNKIKLKATTKMFCRKRCPIINILLFSFLNMIFITGCTKTSEPRDQIIIKNNLIYEAGAAFPFTGTVKDTIDGKIIQYAVVDGKKNGMFMMYFPNGQIEMKGTIKENLNEGKWTYYYQTGPVESEGDFKNDLPEGKWKWYYENGYLREEGNYIQGNREGEWIMYDIDGKVKETKKFKNNLVTE